MHGLGSLLGRPLPNKESLPRIKLRHKPQLPLIEVLVEPIFEKFGYVGDADYPWKPTQGYVRWIPPAETALQNQVEYDMDEQDLEWLDLVNAERRKDGGSSANVPREVFEIIIDKLEKEWFDLTSRIPKPGGQITAEESICSICDDGECESSNAIVFCDGCNMAVHQDCYGVPYIPEGQWLCRKCTVSPDKPVSCVLCPIEAGAFKQTTHGGWAHLLCAIFVPEVGVSNTVYMEPIDGVEHIPKSRWKLTCYLCRRKGGAPIQCAKKSCFSAFHVTCAREYGLTLQLKRPSDDTEHKAFCHRHPPAVETETDHPSPSTPAAPQAGPSSQPISAAASMPKKRERDIAIPFPKRIKKAKTSLAYTKSFVASGPPIIPQYMYQKVGEQIFPFIKIRNKEKFLTMVCKYWSLKREARRGAGFLKRLHLEPWTAATTARELTETEKALKLTLMSVLKADLEKVRSLSDFVVQREQRKAEQANLLNTMLDTFVYPQAAIMRSCLARIQKFDVQELFVRTPARTSVPDDYFEIIKRPVSWESIAASISSSEYPDLASFEDDVKLVFNNAIIYNKPETTYHKNAKMYLKKAQAVFDEIAESYTPSIIEQQTNLKNLLTEEIVEGLFTYSATLPYSTPPPTPPPEPETVTEESDLSELEDEEIQSSVVGPIPDTIRGQSQQTKKSTPRGASLMRDLDLSGVLASTSRSGRATRDASPTKKTDARTKTKKLKKKPTKIALGNPTGSSELSDLSENESEPILHIRSSQSHMQTQTRNNRPKANKAESFDSPVSELSHYSYGSNDGEFDLPKARAPIIDRRRSSRTATELSQREPLPTTSLSRSTRSARPQGTLKEVHTQAEHGSDGSMPTPRASNKRRAQSIQDSPATNSKRKKTSIKALPDVEDDGDAMDVDEKEADPRTTQARFDIQNARTANLTKEQVEAELKSLKVKMAFGADRKLEDGELVWVQWPGQPYWPAELDVENDGDDAALSKTKQSLVSKSKPIIVYFFGEERLRAAVHHSQLLFLGEDLYFDALMLRKYKNKQVHNAYFDAIAMQEIPGDFN